MRDLFSENDYLSYVFPEPQYLGSKHIHRGWIAQFIPSKSHVALDAFGGSQSIAFLFKQLGKQTITNDFLSFNNQIGKALIENCSVKLDKNDVEILFGQNSNPKEFNLMERLYSDLFFTQDEASFIDMPQFDAKGDNGAFCTHASSRLCCRPCPHKAQPQFNQTP